jgi:hypothetical protein
LQRDALDAVTRTTNGRNAMTTAQDQIADIISESIHEDSGHIFGIDEAADAILAALPDMIAPLVWSGGPYFWRSGNYTLSFRDGIDPYRVEFRGGGKLFKSKPKAVAFANTHHRAAIMAAFQTPPTITP